MLEIRDLDVHYGRVSAVKSLSVSVREGEVVALVGPNGAGKSTTMMTVAGALRPTKGTVRLSGEDLVGMPPEQIVRRGIALVPERRRIFSTMTVLENLSVAGAAVPDKHEMAEEIQRLVERFPILGERRDALAGSLSGGEQQQLAIARALLSKPKLLMMDEPSLGLAPQLVDRVFETISELRDEGVSIFLVEQHVTKALEICTRGYIIKNGRIVLEGHREDLLQPGKLEQAYLA